MKAKQGSKNNQRGSVDSSSEPHFLVIGEIAKPHGVRGEVRVLPHTDVPERFTWLKQVYLDEGVSPPVPVVSARLHQGIVLLKLEGYDSREGCERLRGRLLYVPEAEAVPLEEGEYFLYQLEGLGVYTEAGEHLGTLVEVLETKANNVFVVQGGRGEVLLPDIAEVVREIDFAAGRMVVHLLPGLLPD